MEVKKVYVVFKTHLDVGFTDFSAKVVEKYKTQFIPKVFDMKFENFIWTTGSWLIAEFLRTATPESQAKMENAIRTGRISWHALPFTTHTEYMDAGLFEYGLSLSQKLDKAYGRKTIGGKMTDVPGHTVAMVPILARNGVEFLHLGKNPACTAPDVPGIFRWRAATGEEVVVMYDKDYGQDMVIPGTGEAVYFAHTGDNNGPPSEEDLTLLFQELAKKYPGAQLVAADLTTVAKAVLPIRESLPVFTQEMGDTWIHGVGTDPRKTSGFRGLLRLRSSLPSAEAEALNRELLPVPEHTWGMDEKTHLIEFMPFVKKLGELLDGKSFGEMEKLWTEAGGGLMGLVNSLPAEKKERALSLLEEHRFTAFSREAFEARRVEEPFRKMERSWQEQREYLNNAVAALSPENRARAQKVLEEYKIPMPDLTGFQQKAAGDVIQAAGYQLVFRPDGAICRLTKGEKLLADEAHLWCAPCYEAFCKEDYDRFQRQYLVAKPLWAVLDTGKVGMESGISGHKTAQITLTGVYVKENRVVATMEIAGETHTRYGAPGKLATILDLFPDRVEIDFAWWEKPASRVAEAIWLGICPMDSKVSLGKLGAWIDPLGVVSHGNRALHAVDAGVRAGDLFIETLDTALVAPGTPHLTNFDDAQPSLEQGVFFNLYNNIWGTNFPMWYEEDARFRFVVTF